MARRIFGIGETVLDVVFKDDQPQKAVPGGSTFNAMVSVGRSVGREHKDIEIMMLTETGDDHIGDIITRFMAQNHLSTKYVERAAGQQTHVSMAFLDQNNDAHYEFYKNHAASELQAREFKQIQFCGDDILLFGSYFAINPKTRCHTREIFAKAHDQSALLYYDINFRPTYVPQIPQLIDSIKENIALSSVVRGSREDFQYLFQETDAQKIYADHIAPYCPYFIMSDGANPLTLITPKFTRSYPAAKIKTISTIGAGDNFNAGFIYGLIQEKLNSLDDASPEQWDRLVYWGQKFSAQVCQSLFNYIEPDSLFD